MKKKSAIFVVSANYWGMRCRGGHVGGDSEKGVTEPFLNRDTMGRFKGFDD